MMGKKVENTLIEGLIQYVSGDQKLNDSTGQRENCSLHVALESGGPATQRTNSGHRDIELNEDTSDPSIPDVPMHRAGAESWEIPRTQLQLTKKLGEGDGGVVYKCKWRGLDCAAKLLTQEFKSSIARYDIVNEISVLSRLTHPNLVLFLGACTIGNGPLLILSEYMPGGSLEDRYEAMSSYINPRQQNSTPWRPPAKLVLQWMIELSRAVNFLHSCKTPVIHRDLKMSNLLLTEEDHLKVSDFGVYRTLRRVRDDPASYSMMGNTGSLRYMAPEVVRRDAAYDEKVDIYSMGMIFLYVASGVQPFEGVDPTLIADLAGHRAIRPPTEILAWPDLEALVTDMWSHDPVRRPAAADVVDRLESLGPRRDLGPPPVSTFSPCGGSCQLM